MSSLQKNKKLMQEMQEFNIIADALKQIASGQMATKRKQYTLAQKIIDGIRAITYSKEECLKERELHIMLSCDQRFCRRFVKPLNKYLENIIKILGSKEGEYEYKVFSDNGIQKIEEGGFTQVAGALNGAEPYEYRASVEYKLYKPHTNKIDIIILGLQSHEVANKIDDYDETIQINIIKRKMIRSFNEAETFASSVECLYGQIYIYSYCMQEEEYICYKSGFRKSLQPLIHLSEEVYLYASMSACMENTVRTQVMSEAAENSEQEAKKAKVAFNRERQNMITASTALITLDD